MTDNYLHSKQSGPPNRDRAALSVSQLNRRAKRLLEGEFTSVWVEGEISNLSQPSSGHWYFTLKDSGAQIRAAMFKSSNQRLRFQVQHGQKVLLRGKLSLFEARGDYQLIAEHLEPVGAGDLALAFEQLKQKLNDEGLFDPARKRPLPTTAQHIAVVTSATGAAIQDIISVLGRRSPASRITVIPSPVQGSDAPARIARGVRLANFMVKEGRADFDVILIARGGGSQEDLWAFNHEKLARIIFDSELLTVSAVGHETDFSISDFVADHRAPTPSAAAELLSADCEELKQSFAGYQQLLQRAMQQKIDRDRKQLQLLRAQLQHPGQRLNEQRQRLDEMELRLGRGWQQQLSKQQHRAELLKLRLQQCPPREQIKQQREGISHFQQRLQSSLYQTLGHKQQQLKAAAQLLNSVSPLAVLERGYSMIQLSNGDMVRDSAQLKAGDSITATLASGTLTATIDGTS